MSRKVKLSVSAELLIDCLHLPEGTSIEGVSFDPYGEIVDFVISHDDFSNMVTGFAFTAQPIIKTTYNDNGDVIGYEFVEWGLRLR